MALNPALLAKLHDLPENVRGQVRIAYQKMQGWAGDLRGVDTKEDSDGWQVTLWFEGGTIDVVIPSNDKKEGHEG